MNVSLLFYRNHGKHVLLNLTKNTAMNNVIKILFAVILVFVAFLWLSTIFKTCNKPKSIIGNTPEEVNTDLPGDDFFDESETLSDTTSYFEEEANSDQKNIYDEIDRIAAERQNAENKEEITKKVPEPSNSKETTQNDQPKNEVNTNSVSTSQSSTTNDRFMVITASFLLEKNADDAVIKLKKIGFSKAEKVVFDNSQYFSTLAGRTTSLKQAEDLVVKLKQNGYKDSRIIEKK
jgi:hypothetical protein